MQTNYALCGRCGKKGVQKVDSNLYQKTMSVKCNYCDAAKVYSSYANDEDALTLEEMGLHITDDFRRYQPAPKKPLTRQEALDGISFARADLDSVSRQELPDNLREHASQIRNVLDTLETYLRQTYAEEG